MAWDSTAVIFGDWIRYSYIGLKEQRALDLGKLIKPNAFRALEKQLVLKIQ